MIDLILSCMHRGQKIAKMYLLFLHRISLQHVHTCTRVVLELSFHKQKKEQHQRELSKFISISEQQWKFYVSSPNNSSSLRSTQSRSAKIDLSQISILETVWLEITLKQYKRCRLFIEQRTTQKGRVYFF